MKVEKVPISSLKADPANARKHPQKNLDAIAGSLSTFGQQRPLVVWESIVIAGNGTLEVARGLGWTDIFITRVPAGWDYEKARAYALADNRTGELSSWDPDVLANQLLELDSVGWDVSDFGFTAMGPPLDPEPFPSLPHEDTCPTCGRFT